MELDYGPVHLVAGDLTMYKRENAYTPDGSNLVGVDHTVGFLGTYGYGGDPVMPSVKALSPNTVGKMTGTDLTAAGLRADPRGRDPSAPLAAGAVLNPPNMESDFVATDPTEFFTGPQTDVELSHWLTRPRQKLILWAYDKQTGRRVRWLESPRPGMKVDVNGGPFPISHDVVNASGEPNTVAVHFQVTTRVSPCPIGSDRLVIAHQWQMTHAPDENGYLSRVIEGEVVFHMGVMSVISARPDLIMNQFIHPIPLGFQRKPPTVTLSPRGDTVKYTIIDVDPTIIFSPGDSGAASIQIMERHELQVPYAQSAKDPGRQVVKAWWQ